MLKKELETKINNTAILYRKELCSKNDYSVAIACKGIAITLKDFCEYFCIDSSLVLALEIEADAIILHMQTKKDKM